MQAINYAIVLTLHAILNAKRTLFFHTVLVWQANIFANSYSMEISVDSFSFYFTILISLCTEIGMRACVISSIYISSEWKSYQSNKCMGTLVIQMQGKKRNHLSFKHVSRLSTIRTNDNNNIFKTNHFGAIEFDSCGQMRQTHRKKVRKWVSFWSFIDSAHRRPPVIPVQTNHIQLNPHFILHSSQKHPQNSTDCILIVYSQYMDMYVLLMEVVYNRNKNVLNHYTNGIRLNYEMNHTENLIKATGSSWNLSPTNYITFIF